MPAIPAPPVPLLHAPSQILGEGVELEDPEPIRTLLGGLHSLGDNVGNGYSCTLLARTVSEYVPSCIADDGAALKLGDVRESEDGHFAAQDPAVICIDDGTTHESRERRRAIRTKERADLMLRGPRAGTRNGCGVRSPCFSEIVIGMVAGKFSPEWIEAPMGDKSPKNKQREKNQKSAAKTQAKTNQANRQASFAAPGKEKKK